MKCDSNFRAKLKKLLDLQNGVLTKNDLRMIISPTSDVDFYRQMKKLLAEGLIRRVQRSFYVGEEYSIESLVMNLRPNSYLSLEYALAYYNMIGTYSKSKVRPLIAQKVRKVETEFVTIEFKSLSENLMFGIDIIDGVRIATKEKALIDTLYFYLKGTKFYFDIYSDIDVSDIDLEKVLKYLVRYKNPKFIKFVKDFLDD